MDIEKYRNTYRESIIPPNYNGHRNALFNLLACIFLCVASLCFLEVAGWPALGGFGAGLVVFNLFEYSFHRWISHRKRPGLERSYRRHTGEHHGFFSAEQMTSPLLLDYHVTIMPTGTIFAYFILFFLVFSLPIRYFFGASPAAAFSAGIAVSLLQLDQLHYYYHLDDRAPLSRLLNCSAYFRYLKRSHAMHHDRSNMVRHGFNITHPLFDWIFNTLSKENKHGS